MSPPLPDVILDHIDEIVYLVRFDTDAFHQGAVQFVSQRVRDVLGYEPADFISDPGLWFRSLHPDDVPDVVVSTQAIFERKTPATRRFRLRHRETGEYRWFEDRVVPQLGPDGAVVGQLGVARDVTDRIEAEALERQLRQSQKMDAIGRLAAGLAHDFNNLLTIIHGHAEILGDAADAAPLAASIQQIKAASSRAGAITRQLLAFGRRQVLRPTVLDLNAVVSDTSGMLTRLMGDHISVTTTLAPGLGRVRIDRNQLEQVLVNLLLNARDAMPEGGRVTLTTATVEVDAGRTAARPGMPPGTYVVLEVSDTGVGMTAEVQAKVFEPFFTTKPAGEGTGLGLPMVYGIVKQSGGFIWVDSEPGRGSTFSLYLPQVADALVPEATAPLPAVAERRGGPGGTVLLVEDEPNVRDVLQRALERDGFRVLTAGSGLQAIERLAAEPVAVPLIVTDVMMPEMGGRELVAHVRARYPLTRVLYISGHVADGLPGSHVLEPDAQLLAKPFRPSELIARVRAMLGGDA